MPSHPVYASRHSVASTTRSRSGCGGLSCSPPARRSLTRTVGRWCDGDGLDGMRGHPHALLSHELNFHPLGVFSADEDDSALVEVGGLFGRGQRVRRAEELRILLDDDTGFEAHRRAHGACPAAETGEGDQEADGARGDQPVFGDTRRHAATEKPETKGGPETEERDASPHARGQYME